MYGHVDYETFNGRKFEFLLPDFRFSGTTNDFVRLTRNDRRRIERKNVSGIRLNLGVSGAFRSGRKKFFTANIVILNWKYFFLNNSNINNNGYFYRNCSHVFD